MGEAGKLSRGGTTENAFDGMRSLPLPGFFGSVTGGPLPHYFVLVIVTPPLLDHSNERRGNFARGFAGGRAFIALAPQRHRPIIVSYSTVVNSIFADSAAMVPHSLPSIMLQINIAFPS
jgi:hypothetical protein